MLFLHLVPAALTLWLLAAQGVLDMRPLSLRSVQGSLPAAALAGLQASGGAGAAFGCAELRHAASYTTRLPELTCCPARPALPQWLTLFWAVLRTRVFVVLCWTVTVPHVLRAGLDAAATRRLPPVGRLAALGAGLVCTGACRGARKRQQCRTVQQWPGAVYAQARAADMPPRPAAPRLQPRQ